MSEVERLSRQFEEFKKELSEKSSKDDQVT